MSNFTIPGLGFAKPNETLPPLPADVLAAAASVEGGKAEQEDSNMTDDTVASEPAAATAPVPQQPATAAAPTTTDHAMTDDAETNLFSALEATLGGDEMIERTTTGAASVAPGTVLERPQQEGDGEAEGEHPEWEIDSSPYESSSESSSSDSSDNDEDQGGYELLGAEETARMLMEADSDDDGEGGKSGGNTQLRTKNEMAWEPIPKPDVTITPEMKIEELGLIDQIVDNIMVVKAFTPGEYQVLDTGSVLCTAERVVIGAIAETIGKVLQPMYTVMFSTPEDVKELGITAGTKVFYPVDHAKFVFTQPLRNVKGSDASNIHDEEVAEDEMEFSDDEKEADHKKAQKQKRREKSGRGGRGNKEPHPLRNEVKPDPTSGGLNYDDDDDGPYKPLQRPASFVQGPPIQQSFIEEPEPGTAAHRFGGARGGRGDFKGRGRGRDRGRGRGGRGRGGGGGHQHHRDGRDGYSQPSHGKGSPEAHRSAHQNQNQWSGGNNPQSQAGPSAPAAPAPAVPNFPFPAASPQQPGQGGFVPPPPPGWPVQQGGQGAQPAAHFNPAFFAALLGQMQRSQGQNGGQGPPQWPGQPPQPPQ